jgi:hypothetical protein
MTTDISLVCAVRGEDADRAFAVWISPLAFVSDLKELIKSKNQKALGDLDAKDLTLWKANIPDADTTILNCFIASDDSKMFGSREIQDYFDKQPPKKHIHIIIGLPSTSCEYYGVFIARLQYLLTTSIKRF